MRRVSRHETKAFEERTLEHPTPCRQPIIALSWEKKHRAKVAKADQPDYSPLRAQVFRKTYRWQWCRVGLLRRLSSSFEARRKHYRYFLTCKINDEKRIDVANSSSNSSSIAAAAAAAVVIVVADRKPISRDSVADYYVSRYIFHDASSN